MRWDSRAAANTGALTIPGQTIPGTYRLTVTAEDMAHNIGTQEVQIEVFPRFMFAPGGECPRRDLVRLPAGTGACKMVGLRSNQRTTAGCAMLPSRSSLPPWAQPPPWVNCPVDS